MYSEEARRHLQQRQATSNEAEMLLCGAGGGSGCDHRTYEADEVDTMTQLVNVYSLSRLRATNNLHSHHNTRTTIHRHSNL